MKNKVKKYLKTLNRYQVKELVQHSDLTQEERWIIYYTFREDRYVANTCAKLYISESKFYKTQDEALIKLYYILKL